MSGVLNARYRRNSSINEPQSFLETCRRSKLDPGHSEDYVEAVKALGHVDNPGPFTGEASEAADEHTNYAFAPKPWDWWSGGNCDNGESGIRRGPLRESCNYRPAG